MKKILCLKNDEVINSYQSYECFKKAIEDSSSILIYFPYEIINKSPRYHVVFKNDNCKYYLFNNVSYSGYIGLTSYKCEEKYYSKETIERVLFMFAFYFKNWFVENKIKVELSNLTEKQEFDFVGSILDITKEKTSLNKENKSLNEENKSLNEENKSLKDKIINLTNELKNHNIDSKELLNYQNKHAELVKKNKILEEENTKYRDYESYKNKYKELYDDYKKISNEMNDIMSFMNTKISNVKSEEINKMKQLCADYYKLYNNEVDCNYLWAQYDKIIGNIDYYLRYFDEYNDCNYKMFKSIFNEISSYYIKSRKMKIAIIGGGSGLELIMLDKLLCEYKYRSNVTLVDQIIWPLNFINLDFENINELTFKKMKLSAFLNTDETYDLVIYSRILNYTDLVYRKNKSTDEILSQLIENLKKRKDKFSVALQIIPKDNNCNYTNSFEKKFCELYRNYSNLKEKEYETSYFKHKLLFLNKDD